MIEPTGEMIQAYAEAWDAADPAVKHRPERVRSAIAAVLAIVERDQQSFRVGAIVTFGPDLCLQCSGCHRWTTHINRPLTLAELNQRAREHAEECNR